MVCLVVGGTLPENFDLRSGRTKHICRKSCFISSTTSRDIWVLPYLFSFQLIYMFWGKTGFLKYALGTWRRCELVTVRGPVPQEKFPCRAGAFLGKVFLLYRRALMLDLLPPSLVFICNFPEELKANWRLSFVRHTHSKNLLCYMTFETL